jgi:hypothetical protein
MKPIIQPAGDHPRQNELTLLGEEKDRLEVEMMLLEARATKASSSSQVLVTIYLDCGCGF